jgi:RNA polymerase-binding transcription factor DksA
MAKKASVSRPAARKKPATKAKAVAGSKTAVPKASTGRGVKALVRKPGAKIDESVLGTKSYTKEELRRFKETILARRREELEELDTLKESMMDVQTGEYISESSNYSLHMEQGTDAMEREKTFLLASRSTKFVTQLDDALARIEAGTYGVCKVCQLLVPKQRLDAVPTAQTCAEYKNTNHPCERGRLALARRKQAK